MTTNTQDPILSKWTTNEHSTATAAELNRTLGAFDVGEITTDLLPYLAAAGVELTSVATTGWPLRPDAPVIVWLRVIARAALVTPKASGPHTRRLVIELDNLKATNGRA